MHRKSWIHQHQIIYPWANQQKQQSINLIHLTKKPHINTDKRKRHWHCHPSTPMHTDTLVKKYPCKSNHAITNTNAHRTLCTFEGSLCKQQKPQRHLSIQATLLNSLLTSASIHNNTHTKLKRHYIWVTEIRPLMVKNHHLIAMSTLAHAT